MGQRPGPLLVKTLRCDYEHSRKVWRMSDPSATVLPMRYEIVVTFDCDPDAYTDHIATTISGILDVLPYMVDNVETNYYVYEDESDES